MVMLQHQVSLVEPGMVRKYRVWLLWEKSQKKKNAAVASFGEHKMFALYFREVF